MILPQSTSVMRAAASLGAHNWPFTERLATVLMADPVRRWRANSNAVTVSGQLRLRNHAGILDLSLACWPLRRQHGDGQSNIDEIFSVLAQLESLKQHRRVVASAQSRDAAYGSLVRF